MSASSHEVTQAQFVLQFFKTLSWYQSMKDKRSLRDRKQVSLSAHSLSSLPGVSGPSRSGGAQAVPSRCPALTRPSWESWLAKVTGAQRMEEQRREGEPHRPAEAVSSSAEHWPLRECTRKRPRSEPERRERRQSPKLTPTRVGKLRFHGHCLYWGLSLRSGEIHPQPCDPPNKA